MPDDIWKVIEDEEKWAKAEVRLGVKVNRDDDRDESRLKKTPKSKKVVEKEFLFLL